MGLFDKVKNLFTEPEEPEEEEIKIEQIKREVTRVPVEPRTLEQRREKKVELSEENFTEEIKVEEEVPTREKIKTPIFFTENDFADLEPEKPKKIEKKKEVEVKPVKKEEKKTPYSGGYTSTSILTKEKPTFKPTPIISPIYGILDKNYTKEDIVERKDTKEKDVVVPDKLDEVRNKAYGHNSLENDLRNSLYTKKKEEKRKMYEEEIDLFDELEQEDDKELSLENTKELARTVTEQEKNIRELEEITMDLTKELDNLLLKKESYNKKKKQQIEEIIDEEEQLTENELFNLIDSMYEEGKE